VNVTKFVDETGKFHLLVFQREFEHENEGLWIRSLVEIVAFNVRYPRKLTLLIFEFDNPRYKLITERGSR